MDPVLTTGFVIMTVSTMAFFSMSLKMKPKDRFFHYITMFVTGIASMAYLIMAFDGGKTMITTADGSERKFFWVRYGELPRARRARAHDTTHTPTPSPAHRDSSRLRRPPPFLSFALSAAPLAQPTGPSRPRSSSSTSASSPARP
jgi:hypothetical protein